MNKNILIVLGGAVLAAVLVAVLVQISLGGKEPSAPVGENVVEVLVAAKDLKKGRELEQGDMEWKTWSEEALFRGAILRDQEEKPEDALSGRIERSFYQGEPLVRNAILKESQANYVAARLNAGERAISIKVKAEEMVAGFISPGSFVDVILTYKHRINVDREEPAQVREMVTANIDNLVTETILENVRVLAIDQQADRDDEEKITVGKTVTLAVNSRQAEVLALAGQMGSLTLAMRGVGDDVPNEEDQVLTDARLSNIDNEIRAEYVRLKEDTGVSDSTVKVFNGNQVQSVPVR